MSNTLKVLSKALIALCICSGIFCIVMAGLWSYFPQAKYDLQLQKAKQQLADAEETATKLQAAQAENTDLNARLQTAQATKTEKQAACEALQSDIDEMNGLYDTILQTRRQYGQKIRQLEEMVVAGETDIRICYLTFDDGPNNLTKAMIEKLEEHEVYATFFTIGTNTADGQAANLRREMMGGHTIANHTYSHYFNGSLYSKLEIFTNQVLKQDQKVFDATGFHTELFRFPSGSTFCPFKDEAIKWLDENGFYWVDWNASAWDSGFHSFDVGGEAISSNVMKTVPEQDIAVVLCHDFNYSTYDALDLFIPQLKDMGYVFLPMFPESLMLEEPLQPV